MNSRQQRHEVRLRGLGGPAVEGVPDTCASAAGDSPIGSAIGIIRGNDHTKSTCANSSGAAECLAGRG
jgi:hypothetical protein